MHNLNTKWRNYYESMLEDCQIDYDTIKNAFCTRWRSQMRFRAVALRSITAARF